MNDIKLYIEEQIKYKLLTKDLKNKYFELLEKRIEENTKEFKIVISFMLLTVIFNYFLENSKVSEINLGPINIKETSFLKLFIPTIFSFLYFKYILIWIELVDQRRIYSILTSELLNLDSRTFLHFKILPFNFTNALDKHFAPSINSLSSCLSFILFLPSILFIVCLPIFFQLYILNDQIFKNDIETKIDILAIIIPISLLIYSLIIIVNFLKQKAYT